MTGGPSARFGLLISAERFFKQKNLIRHDAQLQGEASRALAESLATAMCGSGPRIAILTATGGQGKTRLLKTVAESVEERSPQRNVRFQNDSADSVSEGYGLRAEDFLNISIFIDDAHRLENLRSGLLRQILSNKSATLLIAARPNSLESLKRKLLETGFAESDWQEYPLPKLGFDDGGDWFFQTRQAARMETGFSLRMMSMGSRFGSNP